MSHILAALVLGITTFSPPSPPSVHFIPHTSGSSGPLHPLVFVMWGVFAVIGSVVMSWMFVEHNRFRRECDEWHRKHDNWKREHGFK